VAKAFSLITKSPIRPTAHRPTVSRNGDSDGPETNKKTTLTTATTKVVPSGRGLIEILTIGASIANQFLALMEKPSQAQVKLI